MILELRYECNPKSKIKKATNAYTTWVILKKFKPSGSNILNSLFKKLNNINLSVYDNNLQAYTN